MAVLEHLVAILERLEWLEATVVAEQEEMKAYQETARACLEKIEAKAEASQENIEAVAEHYKWASHVKATYLLTTVQDRASGVVLHGDPK
jgi:hypothetical protein